VRRSAGSALLVNPLHLMAAEALAALSALAARLQDRVAQLEAIACMGRPSGTSNGPLPRRATRCAASASSDA